MTKTTTRTTYTGENPFARNGIELTLVTTRSAGSVDVRVEATRYGHLIASASHPALLWDACREELDRTDCCPHCGDTDPAVGGRCQACGEDAE